MKKITSLYTKRCVEKLLGEQSSSKGTKSPANHYPALLPSSTTVTAHKSQANKFWSMESGTHMLATGTAGVEGMYVGKFMLLLDRSKPVDEDIFLASTVQKICQCNGHVFVAKSLKPTTI